MLAGTRAYTTAAATGQHVEVPSETMYSSWQQLLCRDLAGANATSRVTPTAVFTESSDAARDKVAMAVGRCAGATLVRSAWTASTAGAVEGRSGLRNNSRNVTARFAEHFGEDAGGRDDSESEVESASLAIILP